MSVIGKQIKKYRVAKGISQEQLGQLVGVTTQAVSKWERGGVSEYENCHFLEAVLMLQGVLSSASSLSLISREFRILDISALYSIESVAVNIRDGTCLSFSL